MGEIINTVGGGTPSTTKPEYWDDGDIIWYVPKNLTAANTMFIADSEKKITALGLQKSSARMFPAYSVMMTSRATIGVVAMNTKLACTNQGFITCIPNEQLSAYQIYFWIIIESIEKISNLASGSTFKEINKTTFRNLPIIIAEQAIRNNFVKILTSVCKQIENLQVKNTNLRQTRDLLLPRLISGEIDVENLDINTGPIAA
ncbi:restriction endonuclease subunit S [Microcoleus sp. herbarium2]|uniref:restriction endonuclease subunit S n=1 Tax=Microcoleus sp. herbarium2 TaxID=3055433 RepID=UPI002FD0E3E3